jgi:hypothetical protein
MDTLPFGDRVILPAGVRVDILPFVRIGGEPAGNGGLDKERCRSIGGSLITINKY